MQAGQHRLSSAAKWTMLAVLALALVAIVVAAAEYAIHVRQTRTYGTAATVENHYTVDERIGLRVPIPNLQSGHVATKGLRRAFPGTAFDYVNGGVPGDVVSSSLKDLQYRVEPLQSDVIVINHAANGLSVELRERAAAKGVTRTAQVEPPSWLANHFLLWNLAERILRVWVAQRKVEADVGRLDVDASAMGERFRRDLTELVRASQQHAKLVAIATFSTQLRAGATPGEQLRASASALYYMPFMTPSGLLASYARYNQVIREVAASTGAVLVDNENDIPGDPQHFTDTVHFTDAGSKAMAVRVSRTLAPHPAPRAPLKP